MSSVAAIAAGPTESMQKRVCASATPPSAASGCSGLLRSACRSPSSPSCWSPWRGRAWAASPQTEARLTIDFPRSDLIIDPAALRGPQAQEVGRRRGPRGRARAGRGRCSSAKARGELFGGASARSLGEQLIDDPTLLTPQGRSVAAAVVEGRCRRQGRRRSGDRGAGRQGRGQDASGARSIPAS